MADPGRTGRFFAAAKDAFFWASIVSRRLGLLEVIVLLDKPARAGGSVFLGELGLWGSLFRSF